MDWSVYIPLSLVMFFQYAAWGAWAPLLAPRLLGPLRMSGKQTSLIYATLPIACIIAPLISGQLADQWFAIKWILLAAHLAGAVLLFIAAGREKFWPLFGVMFAYSMCYAATLPLVNAILFDQVRNIGTQGKVFIWAPVAWFLVGVLLTVWRSIFKTEERGRDCLYWAAALSVVMAACCLALPENTLARTGEIPIFKAIGQLADTNLLIFFIISMVIAGMMQFYFLGTGRFMLDIGVPGKNLSASMGIAQAAQAIATFFLLGLFLEKIGFKWTLAIGVACWLLMYVLYTCTRQRGLITGAQSLHGLAYVFFIIVGQIFMESTAAPEIRSSMQALIFAATVGLGMVIGTWFAGVMMDRCTIDGKFQWRRLWIVPAAIMAAGLVALILLFQNPA